MTHTWAVIGAGPAGIAAIGKLLDYGVKGSDIAWIDPQFRAGDFGTIWRNVPSNTRVSLFVKFLLASESFGFRDCAQDFALMHAPQDKTCELSLMADPLQWVSDGLKKKVCVLQDFAEKLFFQDDAWHVQLKNSVVKAKNVILATGSEPRELALALPVIPLEIAMDVKQIGQHVTEKDTVAVFGSSHSAILAIRFLLEKGVKGVINFYRSPLRYAIYYDDWILYDDSGLKGTTAEWARLNIDAELPANLERIYSDDAAIEKHLPRCDKVIYAVGFERRQKPEISDVNYEIYQQQSGMIAPGLFGLGIAFPEAKYNPLNELEYRVGLWKFMDYLQRVMPEWLKA